MLSGNSIIKNLFSQELVEATLSTQTNLSLGKSKGGLAQKIAALNNVKICIFMT